ncbi:MULTISPECIES: DsbA family protein [Streptomyces]|uniref:Disulfide bond formation protein DsbA n=2 Tax=Streptomyces TaxID=1883 RepID=A0A124ECJ1_9ACTN|nr:MULTISPECIES: thioredoxin domain-containing protein [Streptomyces]KUH37836.1 disulfide bond formation protein DsbA [Streptomyces kanasensis]UUS31849.1 DsbA family protein [Streptomyces changanensis]
MSPKSKSPKSPAPAPAPASRKPSPAKEPSRVRPYLIGAGVAAAAALLAFASYTATKPEDRDAAGSAASAPASAAAEEGVYPQWEELARRDARDGLAVGRADAPVVLIEYADFRCGYCGKFARDTEPQLIEKYVDAGVLRIEWRNLPIFGEESERAARAAWAAGRQGRFWQFHGAAYAEGAKEKGFGADRLAELARQAGVPDVARFSRDLDGPEARRAVERDQKEGYALGVASTPSFLINGRPVAGAQPLETFTAAIDAAAAKAGR